MAVRSIRLYGDPVLRIPSRTVTEFDGGLAGLVGDLTETCRLPGRAGLAAPQIGINRRVFAFAVDGHEGYVVNPVLVHTEGDHEEAEGCLSLPDIYVPTRRAWQAVVRGYDRDGHPVEVEGTGLMARCLQHETDHLDGRLYIDLLDRETRRRVLAALRERNIDEAMPHPGNPSL